VLLALLGGDAEHAVVELHVDAVLGEPGQTGSDDDLLVVLRDVQSKRALIDPLAICEQQAGPLTAHDILKHPIKHVERVRPLVATLDDVHG